MQTFTPRHARPPHHAPHAALQVRDAAANDAAAVLEVWNEGLDGTQCGVHDWPMSAEYASELIALHLRSRRPLWIAALHGSPVALLSFLGFSDRPGGDAACELSLHVRRGARGQGIGRHLVERALAAAKLLRFDRYAAYVRSDNAASEALFRACGFRDWGRLPGVLQGGGRRFDLLLLGREADGA